MTHLSAKFTSQINTQAQITRIVPISMEGEKIIQNQSYARKHLTLFFATYGSKQQVPRLRYFYKKATRDCFQTSVSQRPGPSGPDPSRVFEERSRGLLRMF